MKVKFPKQINLIAPYQAGGLVLFGFFLPLLNPAFRVDSKEKH